MSKGKEKSRENQKQVIDLHYADSNCNDCITGISDSHTIQEKHDGNGRK